MAHTSALQRRHVQVATTTNTTNTFYDHDNIDRTRICKGRHHCLKTRHTSTARTQLVHVHQPSLGVHSNYESARTLATACRVRSTSCAVPRACIYYYSAWTLQISKHYLTPHRCYHCCGAPCTQPMCSCLGDSSRQVRHWWPSCCRRRRCCCCSLQPTVGLLLPLLAHMLAQYGPLWQYCVAIIDHLLLLLLLMLRGWSAAAIACTCACAAASAASGKMPRSSCTHSNSEAGNAQTERQTRAG
jgi:hypothetical protein